MDEQDDAIGFLATDGVLYCSRTCAVKREQLAGYEVDQDEYESLLGEGSLPPGTVCPGCGAEFAVSWPEREPS